jgi:putative drug exporter of the RND superfamily
VDGQLTIVARHAGTTDVMTGANLLARRLTALPDIAKVSAPTVAPDHQLAIVTETPSSSASSTATTNLVKEIRADRTHLTAGTHTNVAVTGTTAVNIDVTARMSQSLLPYLAVIVGLAFRLLAIAFRSLLIPLTAVAGFLLSVAAALGAMVAVFQDGIGASLIGVSQTAPIVSLTPVIAIGILFGLAMDYQVFLVSGMREAHARGAGPDDAVRNGFRHSARVVTAAGVIMVSVFAAFILPDDNIIKSIGFVLLACKLSAPSPRHLFVGGGHDAISVPLVDDVWGAGGVGSSAAALVSWAMNAPSSAIVLINGAGNTTVEFLSTATSTKVCRLRSCSASG